MGSAGRSKKTGSGGKGSSALHKRGVRKKFRARHIDQVWEDVRKPEGVVTATHGPLGTMVGELDEDVPGRGKWYCAACSRYFVDERAQGDHERTKVRLDGCVCSLNRWLVGSLARWLTWGFFVSLLAGAQAAGEGAHGGQAARSGGRRLGWRDGPARQRHGLECFLTWCFLKYVTLI